MICRIFSFINFVFLVFISSVFFVSLDAQEIGVNDDRFNLSTPIKNLSSIKFQEGDRFTVPFTLSATPPLAKTKNARFANTNNDAYYDSFKLGVFYNPSKVRPVNIQFTNADAPLSLTSSGRNFFRTFTDANLEKLAIMRDLIEVSKTLEKSILTEEDLYKQFSLVSVVAVSSTRYPFDSEMLTCPEEGIKDRADFNDIADGSEKLSCVYVEYRVHIPSIYNFPSENKPLLFSDSISPFSITFEYLGGGKTKIRPYAKFPVSLVDNKKEDSFFRKRWGLIEYNTHKIIPSNDVAVNKKVNDKNYDRREKKNTKASKDVILFDEGGRQKELKKNKKVEKNIQKINKKVEKNIQKINKKIDQILGVTLKVGFKDVRVKILQEFLNDAGFTISVSGPGSRDNETDYFGPATERALKKFQTENDIEPLGILDSQTQKKILSYGSLKKSLSQYTHPELNIQIGREEFVVYLKNKINEITLLIQELIKVRSESP